MKLNPFLQAIYELEQVEGSIANVSRDDPRLKRINFMSKDPTEFIVIHDVINHKKIFFSSVAKMVRVMRAKKLPVKPIRISEHIRSGELCSNRYKIYRRRVKTIGG